jgi:hypothetical protein
MTASTPAGLPCPNCGRHLDAEPPPFCPVGGQEARVRSPTVGEFLQRFGGAYLSTEGALGRTLKLLFTQPGEPTRQHLAGRWWIRGWRALLLSAYYVALPRVAGPLSLLASLLL